MGTYFPYGASRRDVIAECTESSRWTRDGDGATVEQRTLRHCTRGNNLWAVHEQTVTLPDGTVERRVRFIMLYILRKAGDTWGYKPIDTGMGPYEVSCPLAYLDLADDEPINEHAARWREQVRAYHAGRAA